MGHLGCNLTHVTLCRSWSLFSTRPLSGGLDSKDSAWDAERLSAKLESSNRIDINDNGSSDVI